MPFMLYALTSTPTGRSFVLLLFTLLLIPTYFSYRTAKSSTSKYNVCFVTPAATSSSSAASENVNNEDDATSRRWNYDEQRMDKMTREEEEEDVPVPKAISNLYGTYKSFDGASYYYVKTPFQIQTTSSSSSSSCWFSGSNVGNALCSIAAGIGTAGGGGGKWPSGTTVSTSLSPRGIRTSKDNWRTKAKSFLMERSHTYRQTSSRQGQYLSDGSVYDPDLVLENAEGGGGDGGGPLLTSAIYWDRSSPDPMSNEGTNRWCLSSQYLADGEHHPVVVAGGDDEEQQRQGEIGGAVREIKLCTPVVPSIVSDSRKEPYFVELPLSPPPRGSWKSDDEITLPMDEEEEMADGLWSMVHAKAPPPKKKTKKWSVHVQCHANANHIGTVAKGGVTFGPMDERKGEMQMRIIWNLWELPGTVLLMMLFLGGFVVSRRKEQRGRRQRARENRIRGESDCDADDADDEYITREEQRRRRDSSSSSGNGVTYQQCVSLPPNVTLQRLYTNSIVHNSILHLAFNMWTIYYVGASLEEDFGTIPFLYLNVALVLMTTLISVCVIGLKLWYNSGLERRRGGIMEDEGNETTTAPGGNNNVDRIRKQPVGSVGYSSVLLSWLVLLSLERDAIFPIPHMEMDVSIPTIQLLPDGYFPVNGMVLLYMLLSHCLAPNNGPSSSSSSSGGATALRYLGSICGGLMVHWQIPPYGMLVPHVLLPLVLLVHLRFVSNLIPIISAKREHEEEEDMRDSSHCINVADADHAAGPAHHATTAVVPWHESEEEGLDGQRNVLMTKSSSTEGATTLHLVLGLLLLTVTVLSLPIFDNCTVIGQMSSLILFHYGMKQKTDRTRTRRHRISKSNKNSTRATGDENDILQCHIVTTTILLIIDSMSMGNWYVSYPFIQTDTSVASIPLGVIVTIVTLRWCINLLSLLISSSILGRRTKDMEDGMEEEDGRWVLCGVVMSDWLEGGGPYSLVHACQIVWDGILNWRPCGDDEPEIRGEEVWNDLNDDGSVSDEEVVRILGN